MSMYKSYVVAGRILEIRNDRVLTQQGDVISTYHSRYYMLPDEETWTESASLIQDLPDQAEAAPPEPKVRLTDVFEKWNAGMHRLFPMKRSANRI